MDVYSTVDESNYRREKVYKNHCLSKAVLILECDITKEAEEGLSNATISIKRRNEKRKKTVSKEKRSAETKKM